MIRHREGAVGRPDRGAGDEAETQDDDNRVAGLEMRAEQLQQRTAEHGEATGDRPAFASQPFRAAVPDLKVTVEKMIVAGDYVTVHMNFTGHFTGRFGQTQGKGQPVPFIATDLVKVENGRITDNWHIEDNLTLLQEMGVAKVGS